MRGLFERINTLFGDWYERLFGAGGELHPREVLRRLVIAAEEHRIEGLDGEMYVPNRYKLEIALQNPEEQEAYLTFLQPQELADALWQELQEEGYRLRGGIVCEVVAQPAPSASTPRQALRITAKFDPSIPLPMVITPSPEEVTNVASAPVTTTTDMASDVGAEARAVLKSEAGKVLIHLANRPIILGRSRGAGCDLVLEADRQISRRHARIEWDGVASNYIDFYIVPYCFAYACRQNIETGDTECEPVVVGELPYWFEVPLRFVAMWSNQENIFVCHEDALREVENPQAVGDYILIGEKCYTAWGWLHWRNGETEAVENFFRV